MSVLPVRFNPAAPVEAVMTTRVKPAAIWEQILVSAWFFATFLQFPGSSLLLYPCALIFLLLFLYYSEFTIPLALKCSVLLAIPVLVTASSGWSGASAEALRAGLLMILNVLIMVTIATRLTRRQIVRCLFFTGVIWIVIFIPNIVLLDRDSHFGSKNIVAIRMLLILLAALAVAYESEESYALRFVAVPVAAVAFVFTYLATSATALIFALAGVVVLTGAWMVWQPATRIRHLRTFVLGFGVSVGVVGVMVLLSLPNNTMVTDLFETLGKDSTMTNRTLFWEAGNRIAQERPVLGQGYASFWRPEVGAAQTLNELDHRAPGTFHSFHSTFVEVRVALGIVGLAALIAQFTWALSMNGFSWLRSRDMAASFFLYAGIMIVVTAVTESYLFGVFDTLITLLYLGGITALASKYHKGVRQRILLRPA